MAHRATARTRARKRAVDVLFEADQRGFDTSGERLLELLREREELTAAQTPLPPYAVSIVEGVAEHLLAIDDLLTLHSTGRPFDRLPAPDRAVLRAGTWELLWNDEVPPITAIDEAIAIAKTISTDDSPATVNAILDAVWKDGERAHATDAALERAFADDN